MKIENRVEALEVELKILKNEIQSTLLEIREQVLNHYYPELRAEEPSRAAATPVRRSEIRPNNGPQRPAQGMSVVGNNQSVTTPPFSDIFLQDVGDDDLDEPVDEDRGGHSHYVMGHVSLADDDLADEEDEPVLPALSGAKLRVVAPHPAKRTPAIAAAKVAGPKANRRAFAALAGWVGSSVAKVGKERTLQVVETYAISNGGLAPEIKSTIIQLATLAQDDGPSGPVSNQEMLGLLVQLDEILGE